MTVVGTGVRSISQITPEAREAIESAEVVLYGVADPVTAEWIRTHSQRSQSLADFYEVGLARPVVYQKMVDAIMEPLRSGKRVCAAFYGHPGFFVTPSHKAVRLARAEGIEARMLPGICALDSLSADLVLQPVVHVT
ncbi:SAM-dependent methyltransferase [Streptomyces vastus]|uniref:SAM-dependent methyltransferase n=1 Tax=Streptomyces vastus TaxID=285451 RepID=UPI0031D8156D